jgi:hypothetical protein
MLAAAAAYLFLMQPWASGNPSHALNVYFGAAAIVALAILPPRWRLGVVITGVFVALFVGYFAAGVIRAA